MCGTSAAAASAVAAAAAADGQDGRVLEESFDLESDFLATAEVKSMVFPMTTFTATTL